MRDTYANFADLAAHEVEGKDFRILLREGRSGIVVVAPHGGKIESYTSEIATAIAAADHALYLFEGCKANGNGHLHVTSERFDEPNCLKLVTNSRLAVGVHGAKDVKVLKDFVIVGGRNARAKMLMLAALAKFGATEAGPAHLQGNGASNICNRAAEAGVQLEVHRGLRNKLAGANSFLSVQRNVLMADFVESVREALTAYATKPAD